MSIRAPGHIGRVDRVIIGALVGSIFLVLVIGLAGLLTNPDSDWFASAISSSLMLVLCFSALTAVRVVRKRGNVPVLMVASTALIAAGTLLTLVVIWFPSHVLGYDRVEAISRLAASTLILGIGLVHGTAMFLGSRRSTALLAMRIATVASYWLAAMLILLLLVMPERVAWSRWFIFIQPTLVLLIIAALLGTVIVPVVATSRTMHRESPTESLDPTPQILLECPECGHRQRLRTGPARCAACRTRMVIEVEEPRCACGYLLYRLEGDACPECGRPVPDDLQWKSIDDGVAQSS